MVTAVLRLVVILSCPVIFSGGISIGEQSPLRSHCCEPRLFWQRSASTGARNVHVNMSIMSCRDPPPSGHSTNQLPSQQAAK
eukprot:s2418_g5.t1